MAATPRVSVLSHRAFPLGSGWCMALCAANLVLLSIRLPIAAVVLVFGASLSSGVVPSLFQSYRVKPDELRLESPYIAHNIAATRYGFGLSIRSVVARSPPPAR